MPNPLRISLTHVTHWKMWLCLIGWCGLTLTADAQDLVPPEPTAPARLQENSASATEILLQDRPIGQLRASIASPTLAAPDNAARHALHQEGVRPQPLGEGRGWCLQPLQWDASAVRHLPTYFDEPNLDRLGYYYGSPCAGEACNGLCRAARRIGRYSPCCSSLDYPGCDPACDWEQPEPHFLVLQPLFSAASFYGRMAALPYMMGVQNPTEEVYSLGEDRPGSPAPYRKYYVPLSLKGALYQGAAATGISYIIP